MRGRREHESFVSPRGILVQIRPDGEANAVALAGSIRPPPQRGRPRFVQLHEERSGSERATLDRLGPSASTPSTMNGGIRLAPKTVHKQKLGKRI